MGGVLPNGLASAPRLFTKFIKPIYSYLHSTCHISIGHIDDSFLVEYSQTAFQQNVNDAVVIFTKLGFVVHPEKSIPVPTQELEILGFVINSIYMTIRLLVSKVEHIKSPCESVVTSLVLTIWVLAHVMGLLY